MSVLYVLCGVVMAGNCVWLIIFIINSITLRLVGSKISFSGGVKASEPNDICVCPQKCFYASKVISCPHISEYQIGTYS